MANEIGVTEAGSTRQALVSSIVQEVLAEKAQLLPLVTDYSSSASPGSASLGIPRRDSFTAATKAENTAVTHSEMTFSVDTLTYEHVYTSGKIEDMAAVQSSVDVSSEVIKEVGASLARQVDALILVQLKLASASAPDHKIPWTDTTGDDMELGDITGSRYLLRGQSVMFDDENNFALVSPKQEQYLLGLSNIIDSSKYGGEMAIQKGELGRVFGFRFITSDLLTDGETIFFNRGAVGYAAQQNFKLEYQRDLENLADHYVGSMLAGAKVLDSGKRQVFISTAHE